MVYLSICIPTYNRSNYLINTIESIITQQEFQLTDEVEIVVSDNCSSDDTSEIMDHFTKLHPEKIKYHRNTENIIDKNYEKVLSLGSGQMLKLNNDTLVYKNGSLGIILNIIKNCLKENQIPFFINGKLKHITNPMELSTTGQFLDLVSYWCTWIAGFAIPKKVFEEFDEFSKYADLRLTQVNVLFNLIKNKNKILVVPNELFNAITPQKKGGYNLFNIFLTNYFKILSPYFITIEEIRILEIEKKRVLMNYILPFYVTYKLDKRFSFDFKGYRKIIIKEFSISRLIIFEYYALKKIIYKKILKAIKTKKITVVR